MSKIFILGGTGHTGKLIARKLLRHSNASVTIATRHIDKAQAFADELNQELPEPRAGAVYADAADPASLRTAFGDHTIVVIASTTSAFADTIIHAALDAGVDYLDVQLSARKIDILQTLEGDIEQAGRCFITEAGYHPGLLAALVHYAAANLDTIDRAVTAGFLNMGNDLPYTESVDEVIEAFKDYQAQVYKDGEWTDPGSIEMREVDFGSDVGWKRCYSMFYEELRALPKTYPSLKEVGFYMSGTHWATDRIIMPIVWIGLKVVPQAATRLGKLLWWGMRTFHKPPYRVEVQVQASGVKEGRIAKLNASVAHPDGYALTAIPVVAALLQYIDDSARKPGLWMMGDFAEPIRLMEDMEKLGVRFSTSIQYR